MNPSPDAPPSLRFEIFNATLWAAESLEAAQPLIAEAQQNALVAPPLHQFGPNIVLEPTNWALDSREAVGSEGEGKQEGEWDAPDWLLPVAVSASAAACMLVFAGLFYLYRWHIHRNPPVFTIKHDSSPNGSFHTVASGLLLHSPGSSMRSMHDAREDSITSLTNSGPHAHTGSASSLCAAQALSLGEERSPATSGGLAITNSATPPAKTRIMQSLNSVAINGSQEDSDVTHMNAPPEAARSWQGGSTTSTDTTNIPRGLPARGSGTNSGGTKTSSKGGGNSGSDHAACVRAEIYSAVQQMQVRLCSPCEHVSLLVNQRFSLPHLPVVILCTRWNTV